MPSPSSDYCSCPYADIALEQKWADAVASRDIGTLNPHKTVPFRLTPTTRIGSGGSCFAQRISRGLADHGFNYLVTEAGPTWLSAADRQAYNYGTYSARYGNVYTALQLAQLLDRALGRFSPAEGAWRNTAGRYFDPFRPRIQPDGFASEAELLADREHHLRSVRAFFETVEVFVFTLGMTESWRSRPDGAVFPIAPGCGAGNFDEDRHEFHNFRVGEVIDHLDRFFDTLAEINPNARVILTVSPVPLTATMCDRHVLQATTYSKSVLRVAAEEIVSRRPNAAYFASYELITSTCNAHRYFEADRRTVAEAGVDHVMSAFFETFVAGDRPAPTTARTSATTAVEPAANGVVCDDVAMMEALGAQRKESIKV